MQDLATAIAIGVGSSFWMGYFIDRGYRQAVTYNLIGKGHTRGVSPKRVSNIVKKSFHKWSWIYLTISLLFANAAIYFGVRGGEYYLYVWVLSIVSVGFGFYCLWILTKSYESADQELSR